MKRKIFLNMAALFSCVLCSPGCALTQKATPADARYFSPELPKSSSVAIATQHSAAPMELRLGRVTSSAYLRERMAFRDSKYELGYYEDLRWTERPDAYLRRALSQVLFEELGLRSVVSGAAPVLDVELVHFEEVRKPQHVAQLSITYSLRDEHAVRREQTITLDRPIPESSKEAAPEAMAQTLGEVLRSAVSQIGQRVISDLSTPVATSTFAPTP